MKRKHVVAFLLCLGPLLLVFVIWHSQKKLVTDSLAFFDSVPQGLTAGPLSTFYLDEMPSEKFFGRTYLRMTFPDGTTWMNHPDATARLALMHFAVWKTDPDVRRREEARRVFLEISEALQKNLIHKKDTSGREFSVLPYDMKNPWYPWVAPPWVGCLAQGRTLAVFARKFQEDPSDHLMKDIHSVMTSYEVPVEQGGILASLKGDDFYEEVASPPVTHILNGHIIALLGLYDVWRVTGNERSKRLFINGALAVEKHIPDYDRFPWSFYDLGWAGTAPPHYQVLHARLMNILFQITQRKAFRDFSVKLEQDVKSPVRQFSYFFFKNYFRLTRFVQFPLYPFSSRGRKITVE
jgi:hypothetical protein